MLGGLSIDRSVIVRRLNIEICLSISGNQFKLKTLGARATRPAEGALILLKVMQLVVVGMEYFVAVFALLQSHVRQKVTIVTVGQRRRPAADDHFSRLQAKKSVAIQNDFRWFVLKLEIVQLNRKLEAQL